MSESIEDGKLWLLVLSEGTILNVVAGKQKGFFFANTRNEESHEEACIK